MKKTFLLIATSMWLSACTTTVATGETAADDTSATKSVVQTTMTKVARAPDGTAVKVKIRDAFTPCKGDLKGKTDTELKYGKDDIDVKYKSYIGENTEFRINLKPKSGYEDKVVEIIGKSGTKPGGGAADFDWLNIEGTAKELEEAGKKAVFILCVPKNVPVGTDYKFDVKIESIGNLDPRAVITW